MSRARQVANMMSSVESIVFNEASADVDFRIEGNGDENLFYADAGNDRLGIGLASPLEKVEIRDSNAKIRFSSGVVDSGQMGLEFNHRSDSGTYPTLSKTAIISDPDSNSWGRTSLKFVLDNEADANDYSIANDTKMIIKPDGKVGIGTTSPDYDFHAYSSLNCFFGVESAGTNQTILKLISGATRLNTDTTRLIFDSGATNCAIIQVDQGSASNIAGLSFWTANGGSSSSKMTIAAGGLISGDFNDTSDEALKENIESLDSGALAKINSLRPVSFDWKEKNKGSSVGFIAQEVEKIFPNEVIGENYVKEEVTEATYYTDDDILPAGKKVGDIKEEKVVRGGNIGKAINTTGIVAHLTKAVQELSAKVTALENA